MFYSYKVDDEITLREPMQYHAEELSQLIKDDYDYLKEFCPGLTSAHTKEVATALLDSYCETNRTLKGLYSLIFIENKIVGMIELNHFDFLNGTCEFGYWIFSKYQGRGIITRCCQSMLDYVFNELKFNRIEIKCGVLNERSQKIPQKLGFTKEGILRQNELVNGEYKDSVLYSMLREEWKS
jgi:ribosomal-protein-serine acetyltransferase